MVNINSEMNLRRFDLNLLPILRALLATNSVARAAEMLGLSQSATSSALGRLRGMFGDPLLILVGRKLVPTPYAEALMPMLDRTFGELHTLLDHRVFDPATEQRCFVISSADFIIGELGLPLLQLLASRAPGVSMRFVEISDDHREAMIAGEIDFMISTRHVLDVDSHDFNSMPLYEEEMVIISSSRFSMPPGGLDLDTYLAADHACYGVANGMSVEQWALAHAHLKQRTVVMIPQFSFLPGYVANSNCLAMIPRHVAQKYVGLYDLKIWPVPFAMAPLQIGIHWSHVFDRNPAHTWFRGLISEAMAAVSDLGQQARIKAITGFSITSSESVTYPSRSADGVTSRPGRSNC